MTWTELVLSAAPARGERPAVTEIRTGEALTYAALSRRITLIAGGLRRRGLRPGHRILIDLPPGLNLLVGTHAAAWAGGVVCFADPGGEATMAIDDPGALNALAAGGEALEFGPIAGPAMILGGQVLTQADLTDDLRRLSKAGLIRPGDVLLASLTDRLRSLRLLDLALLNGAHIVLAHEPTVLGLRVLAAEHGAGVVAVPADLARRLAGQTELRVLEDSAFARRA
ncbi:AMP-binding protein [Nonomuraea sp. NPDC050310]|uniref:AMP-binding protein n=1 Tax=Nonomuraea sp. NPDC050310 TaxID=3154935 RepID=UPI0033E2A8E8